MYTVKNYRSKAEIKRDLAAGKIIEIMPVGQYPVPTDGPISLEGPHYPEPHRWYAQGMMKNGHLISIK